MSKATWEKDRDEVRELQERNALNRLANGPAEVHEDVVVSSEDKHGEPQSDKKGELHVFGGKAYVKVDAEFSQADLQVFSQQIAKAAQAVQV